MLKKIKTKTHLKIESVLYYLSFLIIVLKGFEFIEVITWVKI